MNHQKRTNRHHELMDYLGGQIDRARMDSLHDRITGERRFREMISGNTTAYRPHNLSPRVHFAYWASQDRQRQAVAEYNGHIAKARGH